MRNHPTIVQLICVVAVAAVMLPLGGWVYPYVASEIGTFQFEAVEAMVSAALGFGLYAVLFG